VVEVVGVSVVVEVGSGTVVVVTGTATVRGTEVVVASGGAVVVVVVVGAASNIIGGVDAANSSIWASWAAAAGSDATCTSVAFVSPGTSTAYAPAPASNVASTTAIPHQRLPNRLTRHPFSRPKCTDATAE